MRQLGKQTTTTPAPHGKLSESQQAYRIYTGGSEDYERAQILLLIAVQYKQILVVNWIRIKNIIVGVAIHKYVFCLPVCKADSMSHFVNGNVCLGTAPK